MFYDARNFHKEDDSYECGMKDREESFLLDTCLALNPQYIGGGKIELLCCMNKMLYPITEGFVYCLLLARSLSARGRL